MPGGFQPHTATQGHMTPCDSLCQTTSTGPVQILSQLFASSTSKTDYPLTILRVEGDSDTGGTVTMTGSGPDAGSDFVIEPMHWCRRTDRPGLGCPNRRCHLVVTFSPVSSLDDIIAGYKVDVRNVPITNIAPQQAWSARQYMQKVRTVQPQSMFDISAKALARSKPVEWTAAWT